MGPHLDERPATFELLAAHFFETFPQLEGLRFTHRWGGAIDTCSRFSVMFGKALGGRAVLRGRLHRPGRGREPLRRPGGARPGRRAATPSARASDGARRSRSPSRPSRCAGPASRSPGARWPRPTAARAAAAPGCECSTGSAWDSTASRDEIVARAGRSAGRTSKRRAVDGCQAAHQRRTGVERRPCAKSTRWRLRSPARASITSRWRAVLVDQVRADHAQRLECRARGRARGVEEQVIPAWRYLSR